MENEKESGKALEEDICESLENKMLWREISVQHVMPMYLQSISSEE